MKIMESHAQKLLIDIFFKVGVIRVCGTAEFEENMSRNTEF